MATTSGYGRIGWMGWSIAILALIGAILFGAWRYALATNAVALLDWGDRVFAGSSGVRLALADSPFGPLPAQKLDVFVPDAPAADPRPVLVFFYGGGWHSGLPGEYHFVGRTFARLGYVVVVPGYRLTPEGKFPRMLEDSAAGVKWVHDHIADYGGD